MRYTFLKLIAGLSCLLLLLSFYPYCGSQLNLVSASKQKIIKGNSTGKNKTEYKFILNAKGKKEFKIIGVEISSGKACFNTKFGLMTEDGNKTLSTIIPNQNFMVLVTVPSNKEGAKCETEGDPRATISYTINGKSKQLSVSDITKLDDKRQR